MNPSEKNHIRYFHYLHALKVLKKISKDEKKKIKILDIGCGRGELTQAVTDPLSNASVIACDINKDLLKDFKKQIHTPMITVRTCDAEKLSFASNSIDAVIIFDVLEHLHNPQKVIAEVKRVLKYDGYFHLVVPCEGDVFTIDGWIKRLFKRNLKEKPIGHIQQFTYQDIYTMLKNEKFIISDKRSSYFFLYQLFSFIYYLFTYFKNGEYVELTGKNKSSAFNHLLKVGVSLGGWLVYFETAILSKISFLPSQTLHITSRKM